jgi:hypothetical protein
LSDVGPERTDCHQGIIPTHNTSYSKVCGKIIAYQVGTTDAFQCGSSSLSIGDNYVDGISLTHGNPNREHIWTFASGASEQKTSVYSCPCISESESQGHPPPSFVEGDYFCETGDLQQDPLWDGAGCSAGNACCTFNTPPWFYKQLPRHTTDDIEMRVCTDEPRNTEDIAIESIEIYIQ